MTGSNAGGVFRIETEPDLLPSLRSWLVQEDELRGRVFLERRPPASGEMGSALDVLSVVLGSGGAGVALVRALCTWMVQRRVDLKVKISGPDGRVFEFDAVRAADPEAMMRQFGELVRQSDQDGK